ncbi:TIGR02099 family protein [Lysobacteraceae bacterium NML03-0222]|nr:TIGR02099 family protein [Xanthomonadaceae bacterium NML03-0222]
MPDVLRRSFRVAGKSLWYSFAVLVLLLALAYLAAQQGLRWLEANPARVAAWLSQKAGQPVHFSDLKAGWTRRGPLLQMSGLGLGKTDNVLGVEHAELLVAVYGGWLPGRRLTELRLHGLELTLAQAEDGRWQVHGLPGARQARGDALDDLQALGELQVIRGRLRVVPQSAATAIIIPRVDVRLQAQQKRLRAGIRAWADEAASPLNAALDFDRETGDGVFHVAARKLDLAAWSQWLNWQGVVVHAGQGQLQAWLALADHQVRSVTTVAELENLHLRAQHPVPGGTHERVFKQFQQRLHFAREGEDWRLHVPRLRLQQSGHVMRMDGIRAEHKNGQWRIQVPHLPVDSVLGVASLADALSPQLRHWLGRARPQGALRNIKAYGQEGRLNWLEADAQALGFLPVADAPGLSGVGGKIRGDAQGLMLELAADAPMVFDWPRGFGIKHPLRARGTLALWREGNGLRFGSGYLDIQGEGYRARARGGMWFQNDGTRPWIDIAANIDDAQVPVARKFWIHHLMPRQAVDWLNMALVGGQLKNARAMVSGDLDDWPFDRNNGRFEALADIENAQLRFQHDWPPIENGKLKASFIADGMLVEGSGALGGVRVEKISARIARFAGGTLEIDAQGQGDAAHFLGVLRQSPLNKTLADTLARVEAHGKTAASFALRQPLYVGGPATRIEGEVMLDGAVLGERELQLAFSEVRGKARYDQSGFRADELAVLHEGHRGHLALRAGASHVENAGHIFEANLRGRLSAETLLARAPQLQWLQPYLRGQSHWNIAVALPAGSDAGSAVPSQIVLQSDLQGMAIHLPSPLQKPAGQALPLTVRLPMPLEDGDVEVALGERLGLVARSHGDALGIRATFGSHKADGAAPRQGLLVNGRAAMVDALGWGSLLGGQGSPASGSLAPVRVDMQAAQLQLLGQRFANTRLQVQRQPKATRVMVEGAQLSGSLIVPDADGAPLQGRFARLYWGGAGAAQPEAEHSSPIGQSLNPAKIPPLDIRVDDLRLQNGTLGQLTLQSRRTATGMRLESLSIEHPGHSLRLAGDWQGQAGQSRSAFSGQLQSRDFGALLSTLGLASKLKHGAGKLDFTLAWPGAPADFSPARLQGEINLVVENGQLLELEPGAGRVLGLLSVARLPQRLTLDFRDFFDKGLAFDRIEGKVQFANARARAQHFSIEGPAARIDISGSADLAARQFDQTIEVKPRTGNLLPAVGAIAAGPVGVAVGAVANAVLNKPLSKVGAKTYRVTGPWDNPRVEVQSKSQMAEKTPPDA